MMKTVTKHFTLHTPPSVENELVLLKQNENANPFLCISKQRVDSQKLDVSVTLNTYS